MTPRRFRDLVYTHYERAGRHTLPWRATHNPYRILVSEVMLQQTQVERVIPLYRAFLAAFPTVAALAAAPLSAVLIRWQGLGYNRRAKMLHQAAQKIVQEHAGRVPRDIATLESLPGIGPYTARAVAAFAYNTDVVFVETNLRTAIMHHFFPDAAQVSDAEIQTVLERVYPVGDARRWYAALMDYGAHLKQSGIRINARARAYTKQSTFRGSDREVRGALLRALATQPRTRTYLEGIVGDDRRVQATTQLQKLQAEGMVERVGRDRYMLPGSGSGD